MEFYTENTLEKRLNDTADRLIGTKDTLLNTVYKLSLMEEHGLMSKEQIDEILNELRRKNEIEQQTLLGTYALTYDSSGNLFSVNTIDDTIEGTKSEKDFEDIILEPRPSKTEFGEDGV
jgi:YD repeat-containing protein